MLMLPTRKRMSQPQPRFVFLWVCGAGGAYGIGSGPLVTIDQ
jgi:hypothetical protein